MASKQISVGVGIPMMVTGVLIAFLLAPFQEPNLVDNVEFIGSLIGILGAVFFIAGIFYTKEPQTPRADNVPT